MHILSRVLPSSLRDAEVLSAPRRLTLDALYEAAKEIQKIRTRVARGGGETDAAAPRSTGIEPGRPTESGPQPRRRPVEGPQPGEPSGGPVGGAATPGTHAGRKER
ncbi:MAG: hypothetical protein M0C28_48425 [Candidatus Moduliflexus flocculans]|nr:hypothetical protein [Candidatus Moduliflexus flocculans]